MRNNNPPEDIEGRLGYCKVLLVGPTEPYQGGIAKHTEGLEEALMAARVDVRTLSFRYLYPRNLYPGKGPTSLRGRSHDERFILSTLNPFSWARVARLISTDRPDIMILQAWTFFVAPCLYWIGRAARRSGVEVVTIVHNTADHENFWWKAWLIRRQLAVSNRFITHDTDQKKFLMHHFERKPVAVHSLPSTPTEYPRSCLQSRRSVSVLFFGFVRPYKGLEVALHAIAKTLNTDISLVIAGEFWTSEAKVRRLINSLGISDRVSLTPRFIEENEVAQYFLQADAVVLPYHNVTSSAILSQAYSYGLPVIVSNESGLACSVKPGVTGWVMEENTPECLAQLFDQLTPEQCDRMRQDIATHAREIMSWKTYAETALGLSL